MSRRTFNVVTCRKGNVFVAECPEVDSVSQGSLYLTG